MITELEALTGGILIGIGSLLAMAVSGKVPGVSGVVAKVIRPKPGDWGWRALFLGGIILGAGAVFHLMPETRQYVFPHGRTLAAIGVAGVLVGFGSRVGGGCTSGHGVCGIGSLARDAAVYTLVFMGTGVVTVLVWRWLAGG